MGAARVGDRAVRRRARPVDGVPGGRRGADRYGLPDRPDRSRVLDRHRQVAAGDARPRRAVARALRRTAARVPLPRRRPGAAPRRPPRPQPVLPLGREAAAVLQRPQGAAPHPGARRARRVGDGPAARPVGLPLRHPQDRDRPRPRCDREAESPRRVGRGRGVGLPPRERRADARAVREGLLIDRVPAVHPPGGRRRAGARGTLVVGDGCAEGVRHALRDRDR